MAIEVRWTKIAVADLVSTIEFISAKNSEAARTVVKKVLDGLDQLSAFPESGKDGRIHGTRELFISTTSLFIVYRIKENHLEILAILHSARKWP